MTGIENVTGSAASDHIAGNDRDNMLAGGLGADLLFGQGGDDSRFGDDGDGVISDDDANWSIVGSKLVFTREGAERIELSSADGVSVDDVSFRSVLKGTDTVADSFGVEARGNGETTVISSFDEGPDTIAFKGLSAGEISGLDTNGDGILDENDDAWSLRDGGLELAFAQGGTLRVNGVEELLLADLTPVGDTSLALV